MGRFKGRRAKYGGSGNSMSMWGGSLAIIFGSVAIVICLIAFGIAIAQLDTSLTTAISYPHMPGLAAIMGVYGMIFFIAFMALGLGGLVGGTVMNIKQGLGGSWNVLFILAVSGAVTMVITLVVFGITLTQLNTAMGTVNATANYATYFTGLYSIMGVWGLVIFVSMTGAALAQFAGFGVGAYRKFKGG